MLTFALSCVIVAIPARLNLIRFSMGWRVLKSSNLLVHSKENKATGEPGQVRWVSLQYNFLLKCMKLYVFEDQSATLPAISLVLNPKSVSIEMSSSDPSFIVCLRSKVGSDVTLSVESSDIYQLGLLQWRNLFKSAVNPAVTYAVTLLQGDSDKHAILCVHETSIQLSLTDQSPGSQGRRTSRDMGDNIISTDIDGVKLTVDDSVVFSLSKRSMNLSTSRLVELYQHLLSFASGTGTRFGDVTVANLDYLDTRHKSEDTIGLAENEEVDDMYEDPYGYVMQDFTLKSLPDKQSLKKSLKQYPKQLANKFETEQRKAGEKLNLSSMPMIWPPVNAVVDQKSQKPQVPALKLSPKLKSPKPNPPPKPKNTAEILSKRLSNSDVEASKVLSNLAVEASKVQSNIAVESSKKEPIYASVSKPRNSSSSPNNMKVPSHGFGHELLHRQISKPYNLNKHDYENLNRSRNSEHIHRNDDRKGISKMDCVVYENVHSTNILSPSTQTSKLQPGFQTSSIPHTSELQPGSQTLPSPYTSKPQPGFQTLPSPNTSKRQPSPPSDPSSSMCPTKRASLGVSSTFRKPNDVKSLARYINKDAEMRMPGDSVNFSQRFDIGQLRSICNKWKDNYKA